MKYVIPLFASLYALLCILASAVQLRTAEKKGNPLLMLTGGILLLAAAVLQFLACPCDWGIALAGGLSISIAAFHNGKQSGNFHASHHIIRAILTLALAIGFYVL